MPTKGCNKCGYRKALNEFSLYRARGGHILIRHYCKSCERENHRRWVGQNPERAAAITLRSHLGVYGITLEKYAQMVAHQQGVCAICGSSPSAEKRLAVDHDHQTGAVRGLLCGPCNIALGGFHDSTQLLEQALAYLTATGSGGESDA